MKRRILLVDDELTTLLTMKAILEMNGFEVKTATSAVEAKEQLGAGTYAMVITELMLEGARRGYEVIRAAQRQAYNPATAILTSYPNIGCDWRVQGAQSLLVKAVHTDALVRQIEALLVTHEDSKAESLLSERVKPRARRTESKKVSVQKAV